jgi:hyaluronan synthase
MGDARAPVAHHTAVGTRPVAGDRRKRPPLGNLLLLFALICGLSAYIYWNISLFVSVLETEESRRWVRGVEYVCTLWAGLSLLLVGLRTILWACYRPFPASRFEDAPTLTVVIPAYNEGPMVRKSLESVLSARYPQGMLEVLVVDDGSTDDTAEHIDAVARLHPTLVTVIRFRRNRGKRAALAEAFRAARGELVMTLDSDSVVDPEALLALAGPFRNPRVGAVAGKVLVYNRRQGLIPRMLHVEFLLAFDLIRAVESMYGTVFCCPGALTAYRASSLRLVLPRWTSQEFLGAPCTYGEDRALTNSLLAAGFDTVYQGSAVVRTVVPSTYRNLSRMLLRWNRSYVREELRYMGRVAWRRPPVSRVISLFDRTVTNLGHVIGLVSPVLFAAAVLPLPLLALRVCVAIGLVSLVRTIYYLRSERSASLLYGVLYGYFSAFALFWILPYAFFTVRSGSWLTR